MNVIMFMKVQRLLNFNLFAVGIVDEKGREETVSLLWLWSSVRKISTEFMNCVDVFYYEVNIITGTC